MQTTQLNSSNIIPSAQRFSSIVNNCKDFHYSIFGCGAIGSTVALSIARMDGRNFTLYDNDTVASENIGVSQYRDKHLGMPKVNALAEMIQEINPGLFTTKAIHGMVKKTKDITKRENNIAIFAFDNMESRKIAFKASFAKGSKFYIDSRMGAEQTQTYTYKHNADTFKYYLEDWHTDEEGSPDRCDAHATIYCSMLAAVRVCSQIRRLLTGQPWLRSFTDHIPTYTVIPHGNNLVVN